MSQDDGRDAVGSVAEEAAKLLGALSGWAREQGDGISGMAGAMADSVSGGLHDHLATGAPECAWCPLCRAVSAVRNTSPEVRAHLANAASSLLLALSGMMATPQPGRGRDSGDAVERIELDDSESSADWPEEV